MQAKCEQIEVFGHRSRDVNLLLQNSRQPRSTLKAAITRHFILAFNSSMI